MQRPKAILSCEAHLLGPSILQRRVRSGRAKFNIACLNIRRALDVFCCTIHHNLLHRASGLSLAPSSLTLQQSSCFHIQLHVESPHTTRCFTNEGSGVHCSMFRRFVCHPREGRWSRWAGLACQMSNTLNSLSRAARAGCSAPFLKSTAYIHSFS